MIVKRLVNDKEYKEKRNNAFLKHYCETVSAEIQTQFADSISLLVAYGVKYYLQSEHNTE